MLDETCTSQNLILMPGREKPPIREGAGTLRGALSAVGHSGDSKDFGDFSSQTVFWKKLTKSKLGQKNLSRIINAQGFWFVFLATSRLNHKIQKTAWISGGETQLTHHLF